MKTVHMVQQTHWDREWYFTKEDSNVLLYSELDKISKTLTGSNTYCLDAQSVLIEEYYKKYNDPNIKKLIEDRKLFIGPWYTQTDTLLVSKEAIIANLRYGIKIAEDYGHAMNIGYIPDAFGQSNYMPSIFKNCDLDYGMFQRGLYSDQHQGFLNFMWESPDGASIPTHNMIHGYAVFGNYELTDDFIEKRALPALAEIERFSIDEDQLMIPCGWDQTSVNDNFTQFVEFLNEKIPDYNFIESDYEKFMEAASYSRKLEIDDNLRATERSRLHRTIGSSRYDIKYLVDTADYLLVNQLQPLATIYHQFATISLQPQIDAIWKDLFDCHAHDSVGCCNSDDTNEAIKERLNQSIRAISSLINLIKKTIALSIPKTDDQELLLLFNTDVKPNKSFGSVIVYGPKQGVKITNQNGELVDCKIRTIEAISAGTRLEMIDGVQQEIPEDDFYKITLDLEHVVSGLGYDSLFIQFIEADPKDTYDTTPNIENDYFKIFVEDEKLQIYDKQDDEQLAVTFVDDIDNGDTYDFDYIVGSKIKNGNYKVISTKQNQYVQKLVVETSFSSVDQQRDLKPYNVVVTLELTTDQQIDISVDIDNINVDHRVRMVIEPERIVELKTGNGFSMLAVTNDYEHLKDWRQKGYAERPTNIFNFERHFAFVTNRSKYDVVTIGCKEVAHNDSQVKVTLFRSVGVLGKANLNNRPGRASGINNKVIETPKSQLLTNLNFKFKIIKNVESFNASERLYPRYNHYHLQQYDYFENRIDRFYINSFQSQVPSNISLVNCDTKLNCSMISDNDEAIYVRLFNEQQTPVAIPRAFRGAEQVNLVERIVDKLEYVPAKGYITFKINKEEI